LITNDVGSCGCSQSIEQHVKFALVKEVVRSSSSGLQVREVLAPLEAYHLAYEEPRGQNP